MGFKSLMGYCMFTPLTVAPALPTPPIVSWSYPWPVPEDFIDLTKDHENDE
jgi:hypothetical protein